ncbi:hypothetical protein [Streptomyces sp. Tu 3180]|uniref:hypothetical protein n=1 Tax=Streptomyces sp. Tu 3180 TaxID=2682611 RepID=UPI00135B2507|nr:hypothetical protein [Streptomyces sp. Tu 3180]KAF3464066.1 hypothetical protein GL259_06960 [Streptomyces sp. Tu 3180]
MQHSVLSLVGSGCFGLVVGWIAYRTLRRSEGSHISDLVTVVAALGGGVVVNTQFPEPDLFACYALGLAVGFFGYLIVAGLLNRAESKRRAAQPAPQPEGAAGGSPSLPQQSEVPSVSSFMGD